MAADQRRNRHAAGELDAEMPRVVEDMTKAQIHTVAPSGWGTAADLGPVALRLLARRRLEAHGQDLIDTPRGLQDMQEAPHDLRRTAEALGADLGHQAHRGQTVGLLSAP
jgi:hypothetical protein